MIDLDGLHDYRARLDRDRLSYFADWPITPEVRQACWGVISGTVDALIALGPEPPEGAAPEVLRQGVQAYDGLNDGFLTKPEREDLCKIFYEIGALVGMDRGDAWVDNWRGW